MAKSQRKVKASSKSNAKKKVVAKTETQPAPAAEPKPIDWAAKRRQLWNLHDELLSQPAEAHESVPTNSLEETLLAYLYGEIRIEAAIAIIRRHLEPPRVSDRTDWSQMETEARQRFTRLGQRPDDTKTPCYDSPNEIFDSFIDGSMTMKEAVDSMSRLLCPPTSRRHDLGNMRRESIALQARLLKLQALPFLGLPVDIDEPTTLIMALRLGLVGTEQAETLIYDLIEKAVQRDRRRSERN